MMNSTARKPSSPSAPDRSHRSAPDHRKNLQVPASAVALERASRLFRALGDVPRMRLLALLAEGPACVTELAEAENENISTISQRLRVLRTENLVTRQREGKHIRYALTDLHVSELVANALAHANEAFSAGAPPPKASVRKEIRK